jgi:protease I
LHGIAQPCNLQLYTVVRRLPHGPTPSLPTGSRAGGDVPSRRASDDQRGKEAQFDSDSGQWTSRDAAGMAELAVCGRVACGYPKAMTSPPDPDMTTSEQLDEDELAADPLERGAEASDGWSGADRFGTTAREQRAGEPLAERLREEEPDVGETREEQRLSGRVVAILATDGVEQVELEQPRAAVESAGARTRLVSLSGTQIQAMNADVNKADTFPVDLTVEQASADDFDALILPGGTTNPDKLRQDAKAVSFVRDFFKAGKPVAAICHGPWVLVEADVVRGRTLTSYPSVRTDIRNAGGTVVDQEVVVDGTLITSRNPDDLPAFCESLIHQFAEERS